MEADCLGHCWSGGALPGPLGGGEGFNPGSERAPTAPRLLRPSEQYQARSAVLPSQAFLPLQSPAQPSRSGRARSVAEPSTPGTLLVGPARSGCPLPAARHRGAEDPRVVVAFRGIPASVAVARASGRRCRWLRSGPSRAPGGDTHTQPGAAV